MNRDEENKSSSYDGMYSDGAGADSVQRPGDGRGPAPSVQDDSSADQVQGDAAGTDSAADTAEGDASARTSGNGILIAPFCTSASDSIDNSLHVFSELAPDAVIAEGLTVNNEEDIAPWLDSLGY